MNEQLLKHANVKERLERLRKISGKVEQLRRFHSDFENQEFLNWTKIQHENINYDKIMIQGAGYVTHLVDWCVIIIVPIIMLHIKDICILSQKLMLLTLQWCGNSV